jgi:hypothetical protein
MIFQGRFPDRPRTAGRWLSSVVSPLTSSRAAWITLIHKLCLNIQRVATDIGLHNGPESRKKKQAKPHPTLPLGYPSDGPPTPIHSSPSFPFPSSVSWRLERSLRSQSILPRALDLKIRLLSRLWTVYAQKAW